MIKNKLTVGLLGASFLLAMIGCSNDDSLKGSDSQQVGSVLKNEDITLMYGSELSERYLNVENSEITFDRLRESNESQASLEAIARVNNYQQPDLTNAIPLVGSNGVNINNAGNIYYIPENQTFSGWINFNRSATIYVLGSWNGGGANVPSNSRIEVAPSGSITTPGFMLNTSTSVVDNYGSVIYGKGTLNGKINNYSELIFTQRINLNGSSEIVNDCSLVFNGYTHLNSNVANNGYADFKLGFHINGSGNLILNAASLTDFSGGTISVDGKIKNTNSDFARIDIINASIGNMNAAPAFMGKIDINTSANIPARNINNEVTINANIYIAPNSCIPERGESACDDSALTFVLSATAESPTINGAILSATDVKVENNHAYVSYHTNDEEYGNAPNGSLRIFNVQNNEAPSLLAQADFNNAEFNGIDVNDETLYAVGGNKGGARMITTPLRANIFNTNDLSVFQSYELPSVTAKNSYVYKNMLWLVSGATGGGFFMLNPTDDYSVLNHIYSEGSRAKYVTKNGTHQAFFAVEQGGAYLRIANVDGSNPQEYRYPTLTQSVQNGKNVITMDENYIYLALSDQGVAKIDLFTGALTNHFIPNDFRLTEDGPKVFTKNGYTNGVAINDCYLYLANGADGVIVLNKNSFNVIGSFKLAESANYIYTKDGLMFVATGRNGLNIVKIN